MKTCREQIRIHGVVQGVGFRPFVYRIAQECGLGGLINNDSDGVFIEIEGDPAQIRTFHRKLLAESPPLARIISTHRHEVPPIGESVFAIRDSQRATSSTALISPDVCVCDNCLRELFDPADRRYRYPFINCTNCGPRYTIVYNIPYDRPNTSMRTFPMCDECEREYHEPIDRRFHAQPNACPACGPQVTFCDRTGRQIVCDDPIAAAVTALQQGQIVAVRGLGGFHLAVDPRRQAAVQELRRRKGRAEKPFALMAPDVASVEKFCLVSDAERRLLRHSSRPIVLLPARAGSTLLPVVAPMQHNLGFMLPYTPLHYLLLRGHFEALVMTSGNHSEEPIAIGNAEALERLASLADCFLLHDREILQRCDDSIARVVAGEARLLRRSRGHVPMPVFLPQPASHSILACGGELKNTVALSRGDAVFLSQHVGDLDNPAALQFFEASIAHLSRILEIEPAVIAHDLHPEYLSTKWALRQEKLPRIGVQHHHAHLAAVIAENQINERTIGIILDGTGFGTDGTIWGGEVLIGDALDFERFAWLEPVALPGGERAIRQPWRMALSYLQHAFGEKMLELPLPLFDTVPAEQLRVLQQMIDKRINSPLTSSCGRLFDAVSALLGIRHEINYEAQAAIELEMAIDHGVTQAYPLPGDRLSGALPVASLIEEIVADLLSGVAVPAIAAKFHRTLAEYLVAVAGAARKKTGIDCVGLSGGVFQNAYFFSYLRQALAAEKFRVITHRQVPSNDGGLALGQIAVANARIQRDLLS